MREGRFGRGAQDIMGAILLWRQLAKIRHRTHFRFDLHDVLPPSPGLVNASSVVDFAVFENDDV